jgi:hypothetical protein
MNTAKRIHTFDSMLRTRDVRISAEVGAYNPDMMGTVWNGYSKGQLDAMDDATLAKAITDNWTRTKAYVADRAARARDGAYAANNFRSGTMRPGAFGSLATDSPEEFNVGTGASPTDVNDANRTFWDKANAAVTRDALPRRGAPATPASINADNAAYWARQPTHRLGGEWGKR